MPDLEERGVEEKPREPVVLPEKRVDPALPVRRVSKNLVRGSGEMPSDLVTPSRRYAYPKQGKAEELRDFLKRAVSRLGNSTLIL